MGVMTKVSGKAGRVMFRENVALKVEWNVTGAGGGVIFLAEGRS